MRPIAPCKLCNCACREVGRNGEGLRDRTRAMGSFEAGSVLMRFTGLGTADLGDDEDRLLFDDTAEDDLWSAGEFAAVVFVLSPEEDLRSAGEAAVVELWGLCLYRAAFKPFRGATLCEYAAAADLTCFLKAPCSV